MTNIDVKVSNRRTNHAILDTFKTAFKTDLFKCAYTSRGPRHGQWSIGNSDSLLVTYGADQTNAHDWLIDWFMQTGLLHHHHHQFRVLKKCSDPIVSVRCVYWVKYRILRYFHQRILIWSLFGLLVDLSLVQLSRWLVVSILYSG